jgi:hypothetical protein
VFYGSNPHRKDNPHWIISNATETPKVPDAASRLVPPVGDTWEHLVAGLSGGSAGRAAGIAGRLRTACGTCVAWLIGLPRRAGTRLHAANDAEARWWHWQVTERCGGLVRQYRDARFDLLARNLAIGRDEPGVDLAGTDSAPPDCSCPGGL